MDKYLIETKQLGIRAVQKEDITFLEELDNDPVVKEYFPEGTLSRGEIKGFILECIENCEIKSLPCFVIFRLKDDEFVGEAYFDQLDSGEIKVGYLFHRKFWDKGYATEVLKGLLAWAKNNINAEYIIAYADKDHKASFRVMEKCGMKYYKEDYFLDMECKFYKIKNR
ncbi:MULTISPECIES: GNAT family N-acetyltransferase [Legionella]|uniref:GNAT family acetyltransferase n=1 Tax=Legionella drozanskii LLAP-1 TaxID=1212489 RepID=A0A0W0SVW8_9GAMM|nr:MULTISPECIES: GNAT family N-acetyltransferase [Legionella]KTC87499.1 GNAT family acetyltransferase [Legionella drozanskii LLAP-1]PJE10468.1 MAG: N-acetyltransferase [Legionella sp.]